MAELNKINGIYILQLTHKQSHPSFHFHAQAQNANTHALKQHRLSENMFTVCSTFVLVIASDMHLESPKRKTSENRWFSHTNSSVRHLIPYCLCLFFFYFFFWWLFITNHSLSLFGPATLHLWCYNTTTPAICKTQFQHPISHTFCLSHCIVLYSHREYNQ